MPDIFSMLGEPPQAVILCLSLILCWGRHRFRAYFRSWRWRRARAACCWSVVWRVVAACDDWACVCGRGNTPPHPVLTLCPPCAHPVPTHVTRDPPRCGTTRWCEATAPKSRSASGPCSATASPSPPPRLSRAASPPPARSVRTCSVCAPPPCEVTAHGVVYPRPSCEVRTCGAVAQRLHAGMRARTTG